MSCPGLLKTLLVSRTSHFGLVSLGCAQPWLAVNGIALPNLIMLLFAALSSCCHTVLDDYVQLMLQCWAPLSQQRPAVSDIVARLSDCRSAILKKAADAAQAAAAAAAEQATAAPSRAAAVAAAAAQDVAVDAAQKAIMAQAAAVVPAMCSGMGIADQELLKKHTTLLLSVSTTVFVET